MGNAKERADHYRGRAEHFRAIAKLDPDVSLREQLLKLANEYDRMADKLNASSNSNAA